MRLSILLIICFYNIICIGREIKTDDLKLTHVEGSNRIVVHAPITVKSSESFRDTHIAVNGGYDLTCPSTPVDNFQFAHGESVKPESKYFSFYVMPFGSRVDGGEYANGYPAKNTYDSVLKENKEITCTLKLRVKAGFDDERVEFSFGSIGFNFTVSYGGANATIESIRQRNVTIRPPQSTGGGGGSGPCPTLTPNMVPTCDPDYDDPLIIDLGQDGINLGKANVGVRFDMYNTGNPNLIQWVANHGNDAFLVRDLNNNGLVDNGQELFGNATPINAVYRSSQDPLLYIPNGFIALAVHDRFELGGNDDGFITADDQIWRQLQLWLDANANGKTDNGELLSLEQFGISHLNIIPKQNAKLFDHAGNKIPLWSWASEQQLADHRFKMVDVFFKVLPQ